MKHNRKILAGLLMLTGSMLCSNNAFAEDQVIPPPTDLAGGELNR